jgi:hypothetical protein
LTLALVGAIIELVAASAETVVKDLGHEGVDVNEPVVGVRSAFMRDPPVQAETAYTHEAGVLEVASVSGRTGAIDCGVVYDLLIGCFHDVSSIMFVMSHFFS